MSVLKDGALPLLCLLSMIPTLALIYSVFREKSDYTAVLYAVAGIGMTNLCCNLLLIFEARNMRVTLLCLWVATLAFVGKRIIRTREAQRVKPVSLYYVMRAFAVFWVAVFALGFGLVTRTASDFALFLTNVWLAMTAYFLLLCSYAFGSVYPAERRGTLQTLLNEPELLQTCFCGGKEPARVVYDTACIGMMLSRMEAEQLIAVPDSSNWGEAFFMCDLENNESVTVYKNCAILYDREGTAQTAFWLTQPLQFEEARNDA